MHSSELEVKHEAGLFQSILRLLGAWSSQPLLSPPFLKEATCEFSAL